MGSLRIALIGAVAAASLAVAGPAAAHPGHLGPHAGVPGATSAFVPPLPVGGIGGFGSENVEFVKNFPQHTDTAGARKLGNFFYITTERDLTIYDVTDPVNPIQVGHMLLPEIGQPVFTEEDPDTNGRILLISNGGVLMVIDVSDKANPKLLSTLADADDHTVSCVLDCSWMYGSEGTIVDLRDPAQPRLSANTWDSEDIESFHDVTEVSPGIVLTSSQPMKLLDARDDPEHPTVIASTPKEEGRFVHANLWPRGGTDDFMLIGGEAIGPGCAGDQSATFSTWDARSFREAGTTRQLDAFRVEPGSLVDGRAPDSTYCVHWFDEHPYYRNGGLVAIGWYEHGTHFLNIDGDGKISEVGWFLGGGGQASAAYWIDERTVYVSDYLRGLDVLRFTGDIGSPPAGDPEDGTEESQAETQPATTPPQSPAPAPAPAQPSAEKPADAGAVRGERVTRARLGIRVLRRAGRRLRVRVSVGSAAGRHDVQARRGRAWRALGRRSARRTYVVTLAPGTLIRARAISAAGRPGPWRVRRLAR
jgi:hypothetical protein